MERPATPQDRLCLYGQFKLRDDGKPLPESVIDNALQGRLRQAYAPSLGYFGVCALCRASLWVNYDLRLRRPDACGRDTIPDKYNTPQLDMLRLPRQPLGD